MTDLIVANLLGCLLVGVGSILFAWMVLRRKYNFLMSPLGFQITMLGAYMAASGIPIFGKITSVWLATLGPQVVFFVSLVFVLAHGVPANKIAAKVKENRSRVTGDPLLVWFFILLAVFVSMYFLINVIGSGFSVDKNGLEGRVAVASQNKILFYIFVMTPLFLSIGIHLFRGPMRWLSIVLAVCTSVISLLSGSKGGLLTLCVIAVSCFYLLWLDGELPDRQGRKIQFRMLWLVAIAMIVTPVLLVNSSATLGLFAMVARLLSGFDMIIFLGITYDSIGQIQNMFSTHHLSAFSFIFATPMKILGVYDQRYDSMSKFLWDNALGFPDEENLPNDNLFVTLSIGVSPLFSFIMALVLPVLFGSLYNTLLRRRYDSCFHLLLFWWLSGNIVSCILSPQLSISSLLALGVVYGAAAFLSWISRQFHSSVHCR